MVREPKSYNKDMVIPCLEIRMYRLSKAQINNLEASRVGVVSRLHSRINSITEAQGHIKYVKYSQTL